MDKQLICYESPLNYPIFLLIRKSHNLIVLSSDALINKFRLISHGNSSKILTESEWAYIEKDSI